MKANSIFLLHSCLIFAFIVGCKCNSMHKCCACWCDGGGGTERVNALRCARPISALRRSPSPPPPASSGPSTGNRDPGLFVILAQHTPPGSSPALPWSSRWLLRRVLVYLRAIRGHCSPQNRLPFPRCGSERRQRAESTGSLQTR